MGLKGLITYYEQFNNLNMIPDKEMFSHYDIHSKKMSESKNLPPAELQKIHNDYLKNFKTPQEKQYFSALVNGIERQKIDTRYEALMNKFKELENTKDTNKIAKIINDNSGADLENVLKNYESYVKKFQEMQKNSINNLRIWLEKNNEEYCALIVNASKLSDEDVIEICDVAYALYADDIRAVKSDVKKHEEYIKYLKDSKSSNKSIIKRLKDTKKNKLNCVKKYREFTNYLKDNKSDNKFIAKIFKNVVKRENKRVKKQEKYAKKMNSFDLEGSPLPDSLKFKVPENAGSALLQQIIDVQNRTSFLSNKYSLKISKIARRIWKSKD